MRRVAEGAAFCAAPDRGSDQRRNGTQDVNDPASGPMTRPRGRSGSFTSWAPRVAVIERRIAHDIPGVARPECLRNAGCVLSTTARRGE
jgi:hypothetical protein